MYGGWCSLEEIGPLSQLRELSLYGLENVLAVPAASSSSFAEKVRIGSKKHLHYLEIHWSSRGRMELRDEQRQWQHAAEEVFEKLCPPPRVQHLIIRGYFGRMLPNWMMNAASGAFKSLMILTLRDLRCFTKLPDGWRLLPSLKLLDIRYAAAIKSVGFEFQASSSLTAATSTAAAFPNLTHLALEDLCEWRSGTERSRM